MTTDIPEEAKQKVRQWAEEGCTLSEIQSKLSEECDLSLTYMDVRFLVIELGLDINDPKHKAQSVPKEAVSETSVAAAPAPGDPLDGGGVAVEISPVTEPGSLASGTVRFSGGETAKWSLDQMGRLALAADNPAFRPSESDIQAFQTELKSLIERKVF